MKKYTKNIIFIVVIAVLVAYFSLKDNFSEIMIELLNINIWWIVFACFLMLLSWLLKSLSLFHFIRQFNKQYPLKKVFSLTVMTQFFNGVTPFASGGQPADIYILKKEKIDIPTGTTIIFQNFIAYQLALIFFALCAIILNYKYGIFAHIPFLRDLVVISFIINILLIVGYTLVSYDNKIMKWFVKIIIKLGVKLKIIKNK
ncbi:MAG: lysylphosphatidylglycerol synthase transmembrane domain-containing protein, partial [Bacilli bacterium]